MRRYLGLDVHKHYIHGYWFRPGHKGAHCRFPNTPEGWQQLAAQITPDTAVALEATGNAFQLYDLLVARAGQVAVAPPLLLKRFGSGRHTDRVDAERLAKMLALGTLPTVWGPPAEVRVVRALLQQVEACTRMARAWQNRAKSALLRQGWALPAREPVTTWLATHGAAVDEPTRILVTSALTLAEQAAAEADRLRSEILRRAPDQPALAWLWSLPGVGPWVAVVLWAILGDAQRFHTARQVTRYAGLDPTVHQSGAADWRGHISRQGSPLLRRVLVEAAWWAVCSADGPWAAQFAAWAPRLGKRRAIVAIARKLLVAAWRVWKDQRLAREVDRRRFQKKLSRIRATFRDLPPYPWAARWAQWTGTTADEGPPTAVPA
ncbi:MAG: IS110 family transposase [Firmicutes bacterium]|nr:IS110 family transposase [Bacillota bacterium]